MTTEANRISAIRHDILAHVARAFLEKGPDFGPELDKIPFLMRPKGAQHSRCCLYKDRAIIRFRCVAALGFRIEDEEDDSIPLAEYGQKALRRAGPSAPILTVCDIACRGCVPARFFVTDVCQGCVGRPCESACRFHAISRVRGKSYIDPEKCRNCGKCHDACPYQAIVRLKVPCEEACPVRAIQKGETAHASIDPNKCTSCGRCMRACPFGTIIERSEIIDVLAALKSGRHVTALVAPAIVGQFPADLGKVIGGLRRLGFSSVLEVASGADITSRTEADEFVERMQKGEKFMTTSCCPAFVTAVRRHMPEVLPFVSSTGTPMHYAAQLAREANPDTVTVFIGPCVAKRFEALEDACVSYVLTFEELNALFDAAGIAVAECAEAPLERTPSGEGRRYAISGGVAAAVQKAVGARAEVRPVFVDGLSLPGLRKLKSYTAGACPGNLVEVMTCKGGCVGGAGTLGDPARNSRAIDEFAGSAAWRCSPAQPRPDGQTGEE